jgi:hypothetical protein
MHAARQAIEGSLQALSMANKSQPFLSPALVMFRMKSRTRSLHAPECAQRVAWAVPQKPKLRRNTSFAVEPLLTRAE